MLVFVVDLRLLRDYFCLLNQRGVRIRDIQRLQLGNWIWMLLRLTGSILVSLRVWDLRLILGCCVIGSLFVSFFL